jgi:hypothetical protein
VCLLAAQTLACLLYSLSTCSAQKQELTAEDVKTLIEHHEFVRDESRDGGAAQSWQIRLAKKYYARLFKEYALADLSRYKESKVGLRWRTEREVLAGKVRLSKPATQHSLTALAPRRDSSSAGIRDARPGKSCGRMRCLSAMRNTAR